MALPEIKITDLPNELLERFAPDLEPSTISTLRLVCRRFRDVFMADRFYRSYLRYTDPDDHTTETENVTNNNNNTLVVTTNTGNGDSSTASSENNLDARESSKKVKKETRNLKENDVTTKKYAPNTNDDSAHTKKGATIAHVNKSAAESDFTDSHISANTEKVAFDSHGCAEDTENKHAPEETSETCVHPGMWRRRLEKEKRLLRAWRNGGAVRADTVQIPPEIMKEYRGGFFYSWIEAITENKEHYMLWPCYGVYKFVLVKVTDAPIVTMMDVSSYVRHRWTHNYVDLLADQVLIRDGYSSTLVFNIVNDGNSLALKHLFTIELPMPEYSLSAFTCGKSDSRSGQFRSIFIGFNDSVLKLWDLKRAVGLEDIDLHALLPQCALDYGEKRSLSISNIEFPYVVVKFHFYDWNHVRTGQYGTEVHAIINVDNGALVFWYSEDVVLNSTYHYKHVKNTILIALEEDGGFRDAESCEISLFDCGEMISTLEKCPPFFQCRFPHMDYVAYDPPLLVLSDKMKFFSSMDKILVVNTAGSGDDRREIDVSEINIHECSIIGPFLVISGPSVMLSMDMAGQVLFDWTEMLDKLDDSLKYEDIRLLGIHCMSQIVKREYKSHFKSNSISKCILQNNRLDQLVICYF